MLGVAVAVPPARVACVALLLAYYCSGTALLALSSLLERRQYGTDDERSLHFSGGLAEGAETIVVYAAFCLLPSHAAVIAWVFAGAVAVTALQRTWFGIHVLGGWLGAGENGTSEPGPGGVGPGPRRAAHLPQRRR